MRVNFVIAEASIVAFIPSSFRAFWSSEGSSAKRRLGHRLCRRNIRPRTSSPRSASAVRLAIKTKEMKASKRVWPTTSKQHETSGKGKVASRAGTVEGLTEEESRRIERFAVNLTQYISPEVCSLLTLSRKAMWRASPFSGRLETELEEAQPAGWTPRAKKGVKEGKAVKKIKKSGMDAVVSLHARTLFRAAVAQNDGKNALKRDAEPAVAESPPKKRKIVADNDNLTGRSKIKTKTKTIQAAA